jgi:hypothetical protein
VLLHLLLRLLLGRPLVLPQDVNPTLLLPLLVVMFESDVVRRATCPLLVMMELTPPQLLLSTAAALAACDRAAPLVEGWQPAGAPPSDTTRLPARRLLLPMPLLLFLPLLMMLLLPAAC